MQSGNGWSLTNLRQSTPYKQLLRQRSRLRSQLARNQWIRKLRKVIIGLACLVLALGIGGYWYYSSLSKPLPANPGEEIVLATAKSGSDQAEFKPQIKLPEMIPIPAGEFLDGGCGG